MAQIKFLTDEQVALIPEYQEKWRRVYLETQPIDRIKAESAVKRAYRVMGKPEPEVIFCSSPRSALDRLQAYISQVEPPASLQMSPEEVKGQLFQLVVKAVWQSFQVKSKQQKAGTKPLTDLQEEVTISPYKLLKQHIDRLLPKDVTFQDIGEQTLMASSPMIDSMIKRTGDPESARSLQQAQDSGWQESLNMMQQSPLMPLTGLISRGWLKNMLPSLIVAKVTGTEHPQFKEAFYDSMSIIEQKFLVENPPIFTSDTAIICSWLDYAFSVLNYSHHQEKWSVLKELTEQCGPIFVVGKFCIICDRPIKILTNDNNWLHGEGETALEFADGWITYANKGRILPAMYGAVHPSQWQSQWILTEQDYSLQQLLIQEIGATRLCQELPVVEIDSIQDYTLFTLKMGNSEYCILKRLIQETGNISVVFVADKTTSVLKAIQYANQNFSPDEFPIPADQ